MEAILEQIGIPLLVFAACMFCGIRIYTTGDPSLILSKNSAELKDRVKYAKNAGILLIVLGIASLLMAGLMYVNVVAAVVEFVVVLVIVGILWKIMNDKYGA